MTLEDTIKHILIKNAKEFCDEEMKNKTNRDLVGRTRLMLSIYISNRLPQIVEALKEQKVIK